MSGWITTRTAGCRRSANPTTRSDPARASSSTAENIGAGFFKFEEMLKEWENSRGHRENLLIKGARRVGVAHADNPKSPYRKFWAMVITD